MIGFVLGPALLLGLQVTFASPTPAHPNLETRDDLCNGYAALCSRSYSNVTHNSYAVSTDPVALSVNQNVDVTAQLNLGVRFLQAEGKLLDGAVELCHTSCLLWDGGSLTSWLTKVKAWLDAHPREVVTVVLTNGDALDASKYWVPSFSASGIIPYLYTPASGSTARGAWPTLGSMISSGKRLVIFMDYPTNAGGMWETPFSQIDATFPCKVDRVNGSPNGKMYMINHSLNYKFLGSNDIIVPDRAKAGTTNSVASIMAHSNGCAPLGENLWPTFVLLDWVDKGDPYTALKQLNRV
ncbi:PLC-like phosphodiesterase [Ceratobasidium sp. AG-I]|nr:PLC-like phosphodiesterase [Ceratobasidium sp. AG-I]